LSSHSVTASLPTTGTKQDTRRNMDAVITDINEYRTRKTGATNIEYFSDWPDDHLITRLELLQFIEDGHDFLIDMSQAVPRMSFPNGFNPAEHPEDNIEMVRGEAARRGVFVTSE
jgi:hypothetical protein